MRRTEDEKQPIFGQFKSFAVDDGQESVTVSDEPQGLTFEQERELVRRGRSKERRSYGGDGMSEAEIKVNRALQRNKELIESIKQKEAEIANLAKDNMKSELLKEVEDLQDKVDQVQKETAFINAQLDSVSTEVEDLEAELKILKTAEDELASKTEILSQVLKRLKVIKDGVMVCLGIQLLIALNGKLQNHQMSIWFGMIKQDVRKDIPYDLGIQIVEMRLLAKVQTFFNRLKQPEIRSDLDHFTKQDKIKQIHMNELRKNRMYGFWKKMSNQILSLKKRKINALETFEKTRRKAMLRNLEKVKVKFMRAGYQILFPQTQAAFSFFKSNLHAMAAASQRRRKMNQTNDENEVENFNYSIKIFSSFDANRLLKKYPEKTVNLKHIFTKALVFSKNFMFLQNLYNRKFKQRFLFGFFRIKVSSKAVIQKEFMKHAEHTLTEISSVQSILESEKLRASARDFVLKFELFTRMRRLIGFNELRKIAYIRSEVRKLKLIHLSKYLHHHTREKIKKLKFEVCGELMKNIEFIKKGEYESMTKDVQNLKSDLMKAQIQSRRENDKLLKTRTSLLDQILGRVTRYQLQRSFDHIFVKNLKCQSLKMGLKSLSCLNRMILERIRFSFNRIKAKRQLQKVVCIDVILRRLILRDLFKKMRFNYFRYKEKVHESLEKLNLLIELKTKNGKAFALKQVFKIRQEYLDNHLSALTGHIGENQGKLQIAKSTAVNYNERISNIDRNWFSKIIRSAELTARYKALTSMIKPAQRETGCWGMRFLAKKVNLLRKARIGMGFGAIAAGKMVAGVYELETKRDEAFQNLNEIKKSLAEDYESFTQGFNLHSSNKTSSLEVLDAEKKLTWKLSINISKLPLKKIQARFFYYLKKRIEFYNSFKRNPITNHNILSTFMRALYQESKQPLSRGLRKLHKVIKVLAYQQVKKSVFHLRENSNEKLLKLMSYKILKKKRDLESEEKSLLERKEILKKDGLSTAKSPNWFDEVGKVFRCWKAKVRSSKHHSSMIKLITADRGRKMKTDCFLTLKKLVIRPSRVLKPISIKDSKWIDMSSVKKPLVKSLMIAINSAANEKAYICLKKLQSYNKTENLKSWMKFSYTLENYFRKIKTKIYHSSLDMIRQRCVVISRMRLAEKYSVARLRMIQRTFFDSLKSVLPSQINPKLLLQTKLRKIKPISSSKRNLYQLIKLVHEWKRVVDATKKMRKRLTVAAKAFRTWKNDELDEVNDLNQEYNDMRNLLAESRLFAAKEVERIKRMKKQVRKDVSTMVKGSTYIFTDLMKKLIRSHLKFGIERIKHFSGGPMLIEGKMALKVMSRQMVELEIEKENMADHNVTLDERMKRNNLDAAELRNILADKLELEERLSKLLEKTEQKQKITMMMQEQLLVAKTEKQRLLSILRSIS